MKICCRLGALCLLFSFSALADEPELAHLTLPVADQLMLQGNHEIQLQRKNLQVRQADQLSAGQRPNPTLSLSTTNFNLNRGRDTYINSNLQFSQTIERGDKRNLRLAYAEDALKATEYDIRDTERQIRLALQQSFYDLLLAQTAERINADNVASYSKILATAELRLQAGDIAASDVSRIRVDALRTQNDLRQSVANREKAQTTLAYLIGREQQAASIVAEGDWPSLAVQTSITAALEKRPDVKAADQRIQQAEQEGRLADALLTRDVSIVLQYQNFPGQLPGTAENTIGAGVSVPLFTNYQYQGEIARAQADFDIALEAKQQTMANAVRELKKAESDLNSAREKLQRFNAEIMQEANKAATAAEFAYSHGATGITDLLDAKRVLRSLQLEASGANADYAKALAAWRAATSAVQE